MVGSACLARCLLVASISWVGLCPVAADQDPEDSFLTPEGDLVSTLELRDAQAGFVGVSGTVWKVEPEGTFQVSRFVNDQVKAPYNRGRLNDDQIAGIAETLAAQHFRTLPGRIGEPPPVNARWLTLRFDGRTSSIVLEPGQSLKAATANSGADPETARTRLLTIAETIQATLEEAR